MVVDVYSCQPVLLAPNASLPPPSPPEASLSALKPGGCSSGAGDNYTGSTSSRDPGEMFTSVRRRVQSHPGLQGRRRWQRCRPYHRQPTLLEKTSAIVGAHLGTDLHRILADPLRQYNPLLGCRPPAGPYRAIHLVRNVYLGWRNPYRNQDVEGVAGWNQIRYTITNSPTTTTTGSDQTLSRTDTRADTGVLLALLLC